MASTFKKALENAQQEWMEIEGVVAVGQGKSDQTDCIDVYIAKSSKAIKKLIPENYKGYPVVFRESGGPFEPQS